MSEKLDGQDAENSKADKAKNVPEKKRAVRKKATGDKTPTAKEPAGKAKAAAKKKAPAKVTKAAASKHAKSGEEIAEKVSKSVGNGDEFTEIDETLVERDTSRPQGKRSARAAASARAAVLEKTKADKKQHVSTPKKILVAIAKPFLVVINFLREVVAELKKVIWPTKNQMISYTVIVLLFIVFIVTFVSVLDILLAKGTLKLLG